MIAPQRLHINALRQSLNPGSGTERAACACQEAKESVVPLEESSVFAF